MENEFMTADTPLPPCMPFPKARAGLPISSTAKVMYCKMLDAMLTKKLEDENGILFVYFPVRQLAAELSRCEMTVKRSLNELENAGLIMRVRQQGFAEPNRIVTVHSVPVTGKNLCKICFANGFLLFKLYGFSRVRFRTCSFATFCLSR